MNILISSIIDLRSSAHSRLHEFVRYLSRDHKLTILCIRDWWKSSQTNTNLYRLGFEDIWDNIDIIYYTDSRISPLFQEVSSVFTLNSIFNTIRESFDVHFNYNTLFSGLFAAIKLKRRGIGTVYDIADDLPAMISLSPMISPNLRPIGRVIGRHLVKYNMGISEKVTITTEALKLPHLYKSKCTILPNGVDTNLFRKVDCNKLRHKLGIENEFVMGYVGVLREWVDLEPVIKAIAMLRLLKCKSYLIVIGEEGGLKRFKEIVRYYGVQDLVIFTGTITYPDIVNYIACMDAGLIPFNNNLIATGALPLKLFEYLACEIPVISSKLPAIFNLFGDRIFYFSNENDIVKTVKSLKDNTQLIPEYGLTGRKLIEENFSWRKISLDLENILEEVSNSKKQKICCDYRKI